VSSAVSRDLARRTPQIWHTFHPSVDRPNMVHASEEGFAVSVPGLPGCRSQESTEAEALENINQATEECLDAREMDRDAPRVGNPAQRQRSGSS